MGFIRSLVRFSITNHYLFLVPCYLLESYRDATKFEFILSQESFVSSFFIRYMRTWNYLLTTIGMNSALFDNMLAYNHVAFLASAVVLTAEKLYMMLTKLPR